MDGLLLLGGGEPPTAAPQLGRVEVSSALHGICKRLQGCTVTYARERYGKHGSNLCAGLAPCGRLIQAVQRFNHSSGIQIVFNAVILHRSIFVLSLPGVRLQYPAFRRDIQGMTAWNR